ncbi:MAG: sulfurtransferase [Thermocrispum sp.]
MHPLVAPEDLAARLAGLDPPVVLDVRWRLAGPPGVDSYAAGHIPGAVFADVDADLAGAPGEGGRHPMPEPERLQATLRAAGVRGSRPVVAYDDADGSVAARAWWLLRWAGHPECGVLDGGFAAWEAAGLSVVVEVPRPEPGDFVVRGGRMPVVDADGAAELARRGVLLDARAHPRYTGEEEPIDPRPGHIPGAVNAPFSGHIGADGRWCSPEELAARFGRLGATAEKPVGAYCGSGVTAASVILALEVAGRSEPAPLYAGSWSHWSRDPDRPAVTGDLPG